MVDLFVDIDITQIIKHIINAIMNSGRSIFE